MPEPEPDDPPNGRNVMAKEPAEQSPDDDLSPMAKAARLAKRSKRRGKLSDRVKVFFK